MNTLIVFVKAPVAGRVKTRLCPPLSFAQAAELYRAFVKDTLASAAVVPQTRVEVAYAPFDDHASLDWIEPRTRPGLFLQQGADLGRRLENAFAKAFRDGADKVAIIGSDTPQLDPAIVAKAFSALDRKEAVLGPARDGGYYLIGLRKTRPCLFARIPWSSDKVFAETVARARLEGVSLECLPELNDIDTFADLKRLADALRNQPGRAPFTRQALAALSGRELLHDAAA
ncbi:MAG: TIGR04282 family arsenosugar biosynthesis glycosyltransferase [Elusimicrobia bacterium]|nr:TIGR04282 family arsenosugar biosynthesis glycosyltransferase [Elusimicrobiota bacterium]